MDFRIGEGWDIHALVPGRRLVLGGVEIAYSTGLLGHSDADVLLHAITDALLGAARALNIVPEQVNVKAKTAERLGPVGQGLAMEARAVVLLQRVALVPRGPLQA